MVNSWAGMAGEHYAVIRAWWTPHSLKLEQRVSCTINCASVSSKDLRSNADLEKHSEVRLRPGTNKIRIEPAYRVEACSHQPCAQRNIS